MFGEGGMEGVEKRVKEGVREGVREGLREGVREGGVREEWVEVGEHEEFTCVE